MILHLLSKVTESVVLSPAAAIRGSGQSGGAGNLAHGAQGVGLLRGRGFVTSGDGSVDHSVGS